MSKRYIRKVNTKTHQNYKVNIEEYNSANELAGDIAGKTIKNGGWHEPECRDWSGVRSYDEALNLLRNGYEPVVNRLKAKVKDMSFYHEKRMAFRNALVGFAPVVPLALMGVPNSMLDVKVKPMKTKVINVYYDMTCSCGTSSEQIIKNGENLLGAIMELEAKGYKFNLYCVQGYSDRQDCDMLVVKVKSSNQPFDIKRMSFPLTHTAFFRVIGFDWYGKAEFTKYRGGYGHALAYEFGASTKEVYKQIFGDNAVFFTGTEMKGKEQAYLKEVLENDSQKR